MSELSRDTEALLERGRRAGELTSAHRARLKGAIWAEIAGASLTTGTTSAAAWSALGVKVAGATVLAATMATGMALGRRFWLRGEAPPAATQSASVAGAAPMALPASSTAPETIAPARSEARPRAASGSPPSPVRSAPTVAGPSGSSLEREARLLRDADRAIKDGDPARALVLLDEHAAGFPESALAPERSAERVFALCKAGRIADARREAQAFLHVHGDGPLAARVRTSCSATSQ